MTAHNQYKAYTLVEMLVVLAIFIIIASIGFSSFYGLKDAISMNEKVLSISQDLRFAQRSALFLERGSNEKWVYGIGLDFSTLNSDGKYKMFKWCSQFNEYGDTRTKGIVPNYDKAFQIGGSNGALPYTDYAENCNKGAATTELTMLPDNGERNVSGFTIDLPTTNNAVGDVGAWPAYIVFESVSGRAIFYDTTGTVINYSSTGQIVGSPISFKLSLASDRTKVRKVISISYISGKVDVKTEKVQ